MKSKANIVKLSAFLFMILIFSLAACQEEEDETKAPKYSITVTNLTSNQPFSKLAILIHKDKYTAWEVGDSASTGLELLAESGDPRGVLFEASWSAHVKNSGTGSGVILPGHSETVDIAGSSSSKLLLTVASMLVNTNDAFTGINSGFIGDLKKGDSKIFLAMPYDAGTEGNTETAATVPGPAGNGEGYNSIRDDTDFISIHRGVVTADDGLLTSTLDESHRFIGPVAKIVVSRIK